MYSRYVLHCTLVSVHCTGIKHITVHCIDIKTQPYTLLYRYLQTVLYIIQMSTNCYITVHCKGILTHSRTLHRYLNTTVHTVQISTNITVHCTDIYIHHRTLYRYLNTTVHCTGTWNAWVWVWRGKQYRRREESGKGEFITNLIPSFILSFIC